MRHASQAFSLLTDTVQSCRLCPRMEGRARVLSAANGPLCAQVLFVAEAPGRFGAEVTGVPLAADQSGRNFDHFLSFARIDRSHVFVTNAVLCNPRDDAGRNAKPTLTELRNCSAHLINLIALLDPPWVVALGQVALAALRLVAPHQAVLARDVATATRWHGRNLVPMYHPGPRSVARRGRAQHEVDYARMAALISSEVD